MADSGDRRSDRRHGRKPDRIRTTPPGLMLIGGGSAPASNGELTAAELIALARAARREAADRAEPG